MRLAVGVSQVFGPVVWRTYGRPGNPITVNNDLCATAQVTSGFKAMTVSPGAIGAVIFSEPMRA